MTEQVYHLNLVQSQNLSAIATDCTQQASQLVIIDAAVDNWQSLVRDVQADREVFVLHPREDGIEQITKLLQRRTLSEGTEKVSALHVISHGSEGCLQLGNSILNIKNLLLYHNQLQQWQEALAPDGNLLLYGCDVAAGEQGEAFVRELSQVTGVAIAASKNRTGNSDLGGDWELEFSTGEITAALAFSKEAIEAY